LFYDDADDNSVTKPFYPEAWQISWTTIRLYKSTLPCSNRNIL